ncbi:hypothetical protein NGB36_07120 [Streptomyces sp. RB6PN25]|uniref:Uncharacterized protein n=1 Tax=Streptomyces humicola TaxID=2953240 RepID=A0ABT1PRS0_9ACTN|nr:hypothetical protein [Streptomyces humicola]MCQ4080373.1 hypothetical protein [Streptomyces humicola]
MRKFIAHGAVGTVLSVAALVPLAGVSQANTPLQQGPRAVTSHSQRAGGDTDGADGDGAGYGNYRGDRSRAGYWEGFRDGFALGARRDLDDDGGKHRRSESYWIGFRDGYRLGERHRRRHEEKGRECRRSRFHDGYYDAGYCHHRHHHRRHHHKKKCPWELLGL